MWDELSLLPLAGQFMLKQLCAERATGYITNPKAAEEKFVNDYLPNILDEHIQKVWKEIIVAGIRGSNTDRPLHLKTEKGGQQTTPSGPKL